MQPFMSSGHYSWLILTKIRMCQQIWLELPDIKFNENPFGSLQAGLSIQLGGYSELNGKLCMVVIMPNKIVQNKSN
jgi:hypothetical protein